MSIDFALEPSLYQIQRLEKYRGKSSGEGPSKERLQYWILQILSNLLRS